jgi:hypothetical protein
MALNAIDWAVDTGHFSCGQLMTLTPGSHTKFLVRIETNARVGRSHLRQRFPQSLCYQQTLADGIELFDG